MARIEPLFNPVPSGSLENFLRKHYFRYESIFVPGPRKTKKARRVAGFSKNGRWDVEFVESEIPDIVAVLGVFEVSGG